MEIPYEVTPRRDTGLYNAKVGIWLFLASEVMLFGGLFSAYVFLRVGVIEGVDNPWPLGVNVHKNFVWLGFTNTLVLIASSVFVVFSWLALYERKWNVFRNWMIAVLACAAIFMVLKSIEYHSKLTKHHGIKLRDNSVMEGLILDGTDRIEFAGENATIGLQGGYPSFADQITDEEFPVFTATYKRWNLETKVYDIEVKELADEGALKKYFYGMRRDVTRQLADARSALRGAKRENVKINRRNAARQKAGENDLETPVVENPIKTSTMAELVAAEPFTLKPKPRKVTGHTEKTLSYIDGVAIEGKLVRDAVIFEPHEVDLQMVPYVRQADAMVWDVLSSGEGATEAKKHWEKEQEEAIIYLREYFGKRDQPVPGKSLQSPYVNLHDFHLGHGSHDDAHKAEKKEHGHEEKSAAHNEHADHHADEAKHEDHGHAHPTVTVPFEKIKFMGNHGPRYGNYYAIYFTMTALHGLHVIGGALVLAYFLIFGKKMYLKDPEHLANRVEVGGLFWHFVDLVWIFLFPIMYLL